jgi:hypothetical protein
MDGFSRRAYPPLETSLELVAIAVLMIAWLLLEETAE